MRSGLRRDGRKELRVWSRLGPEPSEFLVRARRTRKEGSGKETGIKPNPIHLLPNECPGTDFVEPPMG